MRIMFPNRKQIERRIERLEAQNDRLVEEHLKLSQLVTDRAREWEAQLKRFEALTEEIDERIDRGNKLWRRVRARERREEEREEYEGEEEEDEQLHLEHGTGSNGQGVRPMFGDLAPPGAPLQPYQEVARRIAWMKAGRS